LKAICERGEQKEAIERIDAALIQYDAAQIYTLHGFCHRILNEFAFEADVGFEISNPDEQEHLFLLEKMVKNHLKENLKAPTYSPAQIKLLLGKYRGNFRKMISSFVDTISSGKEIASAPSYSDLFHAFEREVLALGTVDKIGFKSDVELLKPMYRKMEDASAQIELLSEILETKKCNSAQFDKLLKEELFLSKMGPHQLKVRAKAPSALRYPGLLEVLRSKLVPVIDRARNPSNTFLRVARDLKEKSQHLLEAKEKFSPDDLLLEVERASHLPGFVECVRQKYRAAIIDEFQDTDPVQWNIFQKLFLNQLEVICLVGDPKQSIYAFRNADVYTYLDAAKAMGPSAKKCLDTNFRSTPSLIEALNHLFCKVQGKWMPLPRHLDALKVPPVKSGAARKASDPEHPLQFFVAIDRGGKKFPTQEMLQKKVFPFLAKEIFNLHGKGVGYSDIAILIKDRYMASEVVGYLKTHGIPASSKRGTSITDTIAFSALKELMAAVNFPYDSSKLKAALAGPIIAWNVDQIREEKSLLRAKAHMQLLHQTFIEKGYGVLFLELLNTRWGTDTLLEEMFGRGDLCLYLDLRQLLELLIEEEVTLEELVRDQHRLRNSPLEEKGSVAVMTMHLSKGLEFDTVFVLGLASRHKTGEQMVVKKEGYSLLTLFDVEDDACQSSLEEQDAEKMRQLYVALTRAKKRLYVPLFIDEDGKPIEKGEASPIELFFARLDQNPVSYNELYSSVQTLHVDRVKRIFSELEPHIHYRVLEDAPDVSYVSEIPEVTLVPPPPLHVPRYEGNLVSFTSLAKKEHGETLKIQEGALSPHTLPLGSETGSLLHLLFEKIFKLGLHHPLDEEGLKKLLQGEPWSEVLHPWIIDLLQKKLVSNFSLADIPGKQLQQEMEFCFPIAQGMMKGFCDLLFEFEGKYYILDWKSNYLGPTDADYTQEKIAQAMHQHDYFLQASIYAAALERYVKLFDNRPFSESFGGAIYYFIRGKAVCHFIPEQFKGLST
jgi:exodeoxyribonuclease V beta subunit